MESMSLEYWGKVAVLVGGGASWATFENRNFFDCELILLLSITQFCNQLIVIDLLAIDRPLS